MKLAISSTGSFSLTVQKIHLRPFFAGIHVGPVFDILVHRVFPISA
jgi:hypothetical protein